MLKLCSALTAGHQEHGVICRGIPIHRNATECLITHSAEDLLKLTRAARYVGKKVHEHRRQLGMDHAGAFGYARYSDFSFSYPEAR